MAPIVTNLSTQMEPVPVRMLKLVPVGPGEYQQTSEDRCAECSRPMAEHYDSACCVLLGCPLHRPEAVPQNALTVLVEWFGAGGTQNLLDYIELQGVPEMRRQLANLLSVKGGR